MEHQTLGRRFVCPIGPATQREFILDWRILTVLYQGVRSICFEPTPKYESLRSNFLVDSLLKITQWTFLWIWTPNYVIIKVQNFKIRKAKRSNTKYVYKCSKKVTWLEQFLSLLCLNTKQWDHLGTIWICDIFQERNWAGMWKIETTMFPHFCQ